MNIHPLLACGPSFGDSPLISAIFLTIYAIPVAAFANLIMLLSVPLRHRAIHGMIFGAGALMAFVLFARGVPNSVRIFCALVIPNLVAAQFAMFIIAAWRSRRNEKVADAESSAQQVL